ncbi:MAG: hypothetical protein ACTTKB_01500 [Treponema sp.]
MYITKTVSTSLPNANLSGRQCRSIIQNNSSRPPSPMYITKTVSTSLPNANFSGRQCRSIIQK